jgi:uncharacterized membrane protein (DUF2068 family)
LVLLVGFALLTFVHKDLERVAEKAVKHLHLNPASRIPRIFEAAAQRTTDHQIRLLALGAALYSLMRFVEAYGLWHNKVWAEWFALITSGMFIPVEIFEMLRKPGWMRLGIFLANAAVVLYLCYALKAGLKSQDTRALPARV